MSYSLVARVCGKYQFLTAYISCMLLMTTAEMNNTATQTCDDLTCQNSNVCESSLVNGTHTGHAYCSCRGEWAGLRCELQLFLSVQSVTSDTVVLALHGRLSAGNEKPITSDDLFVSEVTAAVWNFNTSDQCLLLRQNISAENDITLKGLDRKQEYLVCIANGFVDSCLFFQQQPLNISRLSTCIYFETNLVDVEPFDIGFIIVPSAVLILIVVLILFCYCQRHSLVVQLCLNKACCRNCYCIRKRIQRRQCLTHRQRDVSGEMLMPGDVSVDFESVSEAHTRATEESNCTMTYSSNASSTSHRSACSLDPDVSISVPTSLDQNTFLYENQSLIPPLYSPQDHKIMTLTYIDDEFIPLTTENTVQNHIDALFPEPYSGDFQQGQAHEATSFTDSNTGCDILKETFVIPNAVMRKFTPSQTQDSILFKEAPDSCKYVGPVTQQMLVHPYLHRPYHKNQITNPPNHTNHTPSQLNHNEHVVRFREPNLSTLRQRPLSLPVTYMSEDLSQNGDFHFSNQANNCLKPPRKSSLRSTDDNTSFLLPVWPANYKRQNNFIRSNSDTNSVGMNHLLCNPTNLTCEVTDAEQASYPILCHNHSNEDSTANTLPRSKKPRFVQPLLRNGIQDSLLNTFYDEHQKHVFAVTPKRPTWLNIANPIQNPNPSKLTQETKQVSTETSTSSESRSRSKQVRSLKSHFEHNLSFFKSSKSNRPTDEEKEYQDLLSPLAAERIKASKKSRRSHTHKTSSGNKAAPSHDIHKAAASSFGPPIFEGHPSEHIVPPFAPNNQDDVEDLSDASVRHDESDRNSIASNISKSGDSVISSYEDDDTNLVTPFHTDNSSDDDTYKDIQSLAGSADTLQDIEAEQSLLNAEGMSSFEHQMLQNGGKLNVQNEEYEQLLEF